MGEREFALIIHIDLSLHICERISSFKHNLTDGPRPCVCASASVCCVFARCWFVERACAKHSSSESPEIQYSNLAHCEYLHHEQNKSERFTLFVRCSYEPKKKPGSSGGFVAHTFCVDVCVAALLPRRMRRGEESGVYGTVSQVEETVLLNTPHSTQHTYIYKYDNTHPSKMQ